MNRDLPGADAGAATREDIILRGEAAAPGIAVAPATLFERSVVPIFRVTVSLRQIPFELRRFDLACEQAAQQLEAIKNSTRKALGNDHAYLFEAQKLMLQDPVLIGRVREVIRSDRSNAEWALGKILGELEAVFDGLADDYLRQRRGDIADVGGRLLKNLAGGSSKGLHALERSHVVIAEDLGPSDAAELDWPHVAAMAMEVGGPTYHSAILARTHGVPCVTGVPDLRRQVTIGRPVVVDGFDGSVVVNPSEATLRTVRRKRARERERRRRLLRAAANRAETADGQRVTLLANIDSPDELDLVRQNGAEGVGLFRTERIAGQPAPDEEEQFRIYRNLARDLAPHPLVIRAFDLDATALGRSREQNPALGLRGTRLLMEATGVLETQIRAVLRAALHGNIQLMFPMVGGLEEFRAARTHVGVVARALRKRNINFQDVPVGAMLELPSAAATADFLAGEADFLSIGTNDLMQYLFGADRANERVAHFNDPFHPAFLRTIRFAIRAAQGTETPLAICGEVAREPLVMPLLLGFGVRTFSMTPQAIPEVKNLIGGVDIGFAEKLASEIVHLATSRRIRARVLRHMADASGDQAERTRAGAGSRQAGQTHPSPG